MAALTSRGMRREVRDDNSTFKLIYHLMQTHDLSTIYSCEMLHNQREKLGYCRINGKSWEGYCARLVLVAIWFIVTMTVAVSVSMTTHDVSLRHHHHYSLVVASLRRPCHLERTSCSSRGLLLQSRRGCYSISLSLSTVETTPTAVAAATGTTYYVGRGVSLFLLTSGYYILSKLRNLIMHQNQAAPSVGTPTHDDDLLMDSYPGLTYSRRARIVWW
jgi:hypothetical protein